MNYIHSLQAANAELQSRLDSALSEIAEFKSHLALPKFQGTDSDGSRKDWIATQDVLRRVANINNILNGVA